MPFLPDRAGRSPLVGLRERRGVPAPLPLPLPKQGLLRTKQASRSVAQPGSAPALGAGGRWFESSRSDHIDAEEVIPQGGVASFFVPMGRRGHARGDPGRSSRMAAGPVFLPWRGDPVRRDGAVHGSASCLSGCARKERAGGRGGPGPGAEAVRRPSAPHLQSKYDGIPLFAGSVPFCVLGLCPVCFTLRPPSWPRSAFQSF